MPPDPSPGVTAIPLPHPSDADVWRATRFRHEALAALRSCDVDP
ncbi:hypothetical protein [Haloplanus salinus]|nr:hypothetical protein [Haloplanus salinus]